MPLPAFHTHDSQPTDRPPSSATSLMASGATMGRGGSLGALCPRRRSSPLWPRGRRPSAHASSSASPRIQAAARRPDSHAPWALPK